MQVLRKHLPLSQSPIWCWNWIHHLQCGTWIETIILTHMSNQEISLQLVRQCCWCRFFSTALEVIPGHPIAFALQSLLWLPGHYEEKTQNDIQLVSSEVEMQAGRELAKVRRWATLYYPARSPNNICIASFGFIWNGGVYMASILVMTHTKSLC